MENASVFELELDSVYVNNDISMQVNTTNTWTLNAKLNNIWIKNSDNNRHRAETTLTATILVIAGHFTPIASTFFASPIELLPVVVVLSLVRTTCNKPGLISVQQCYLFKYCHIWFHLLHHIVTLLTTTWGFVSLSPKSNIGINHSISWNRIFD